MSQPRHYVTCCHGRQLPVLVASMYRHCRPFVLHALAWDWSRDVPDGVLATTRGRFLERHPDLAPDLLPGPPRTQIEQVCTVRWTFVVDVMEDFGVPVTLIDGDMMFWSSPEPLFRDELSAVEDGAVSPHGFAAAARGLPGATLETHRQFGEFNGGWVYFRHMAPAVFMAAQTKRWSYSGFLEHPSGRVTYGDQGLLELMHDAYRTRVIRHPGVNVGPWNIHSRHVGVDPLGVLRVDGVPLISYHYSSFRPDGQLADASYQITAEQADLIYRPYMAEVARWRT